MTSAVSLLRSQSAANGADLAAGIVPGLWWHQDGERITCDLCPRECSLKEGDRGFCFVRQNVGGQMMLTTYGRSTGFCIDPIEKKPLNHFYPGTSVLSFGTAGCNLGCKFCQNWDISKAREVERLSHRALPEEIAAAAKRLDCRSVAYTYNDPVIWAEYAIDTARICRAEGIKSVAVTAGYISKEARGPFYEFMDAANVDLKAFTDDFYQHITYSRLEPVLETLHWLKHETNVWFEITNLLIPNANDNPDEMKQLSEWVLKAVGDEVPVHFTAFHPDFRMNDVPDTPHETLVLAREIALKTGLKYVYVGNVNDVTRQSTFCPGCGQLLIERNWYELGEYALNGNRCKHCGTTIAGHFEEHPGTWGRKRQPVDMRQFHIPGLISDVPSSSSAAASDSSATTGSRRMSSESKPPVNLNESALNWLASQQPAAKPQRLETEERTAPVAMPSSAPLPPVATAPPTRLPLTAEQREAIRITAAEFVKAAVDEREAMIPDLNMLGVAQAAVSGIFVSLKRDGRLRSCMGSFGNTTMPLLQTLHESSQRTTTADPRFPRISPVEIPFLDLEVWLLFAPERVLAEGEARVREVVIGTHGLQIFRGQQRGLLLPGVATDNNWDAEEFLDNVCIKAGLPPTAWKDRDTTLLRFEGNCIRGGLLENDVDRYRTRLIYLDDQLDELRRICRDNVAAIVRGATPMYYIGTVPDATVTGVSMIVKLPGSGQEIPNARMSIRDPMPLQSTLFSMCEEVAGALRRRGFLNGNFELDLAIAYDPAMHGSVADPSLGGIDPNCRAVMVSERAKTAWVFDRGKLPEQLFSEAAALCQVSDPFYTQAFSLAFQSTRDRIEHAAIPRGVRGGTERPAAVAGRFYPSDPSEMNRMLDQMLSGSATAEPCRAVMVPHAGWVFSGKLAADVLKRTRIPKRVIIIGPKHTANGTDWAVAPHQIWQLPGRNVEADYELAMKLTSRIKGLEPDAAAHQTEHGIEVELPLLARLAPETRVTGIVVSGASLDRCEEFAEGLAAVIRELDEPPLLIISSDMNHYATDDENRRLDQMALEQLDQLDEDALFRTCRQHHISMCGMIPAVIVLKALKKLGGVRESRPVGYATSAEVTGDRSRVVGYAGRLFL